MEVQCSTGLDEPFAGLVGWRPVIQITAQMRVLVAIEPVDGRKGIDSLVRLCQDKLAEDADRVLKLNYPQHPYLSGNWPNYRSWMWKLVPLTNRG